MVLLSFFIHRRPPGMLLIETNVPGDLWFCSSDRCLNIFSNDSTRMKHFSVVWNVMLWWHFSCSFLTTRGFLRDCRFFYGPFLTSYIFNTGSRIYDMYWRNILSTSTSTWQTNTLDSCLGNTQSVFNLESTVIKWIWWVWLSLKHYIRHRKCLEISKSCFSKRNYLNRCPLMVFCPQTFTGVHQDRLKRGQNNTFQNIDSRDRHK